MTEKIKRTPEELREVRRASLEKARQTRWANKAKEDEMKSKKLIHAYEFLDAIEEAKGEAKVELLKKYGKEKPLSFLLSLNYRKDIQLEIPSGLPPSLKPNEVDTVTHPDLQGLLASSIGRLLNCRKETPIKKFKKEKVFIDVLLACPWKDAEILCACKDKELSELYPSVTASLVKSVFPAYVS